MIFWYCIFYDTDVTIYFLTIMNINTEALVEIWQKLSTTLRINQLTNCQKIFRVYQMIRPSSLWCVRGHISDSTDSQYSLAISRVRPYVAAWSHRVSLETVAAVWLLLDTEEQTRKRCLVSPILSLLCTLAMFIFALICNLIRNIILKY